jgi:hypothetical protein
MGHPSFSSTDAPSKLCLDTNHVVGNCSCGFKKMICVGRYTDPLGGLETMEVTQNPLALYQGMALAMPPTAHKMRGFSPCHAWIFSPQHAVTGIFRYPQQMQKRLASSFSWNLKSSTYGEKRSSKECFIG